jgi:hypothetical protein
MPRGDKRPNRAKMISKDFSCYVYKKDGSPVAWCHSALAAAKLIHGESGWTAEKRGVVLATGTGEEQPTALYLELTEKIQAAHDAIPIKEKR